MTTARLAAAALVAALSFALAPTPAQAQVDVHVDLAFPGVPSLVTIQPGVEVVEGYHEEVFVHGGAWWLRRGGVWYRAPRPGARFAVVREALVPRALVRLPPGHYRQYRADKKEAKREWREERHEERHDRRDDRHDEHKHGQH